MRAFIIISCLVAISSAQFLGSIRDWFNQNKNDYAIDVVHNYRFEDHNLKNFHLMVAISDGSSDRSCHIIEVDSSWEKLLEDKTKVHMITEEIYNLIASGTIKETDLTLQELSSKYGDRDALRECFRHKVHEATYTPSAAIMGTN